ncbi:GrpB family protein [Bacillus salitolerans]|uniref:GrpB family protein n=1 Tax=Bacillus salitolerans TaxID=1437434 RepID=A0ABW4LXE5_9BACI
MRTIQVVPYNPMWKNEFEKEAKQLEGILGEECVKIHHIGSTSIPGMSAKPIIDILIEARDLHEIDKKNNQFHELGYEPRGEFGIPNRRYFPKGGDERTHHVHIFPTGHEEVMRHIAFRDYLIEHPCDAERYANVKIELAYKYKTNPYKYVEGKDSLIKEIEGKAKRWYLEK